MFSLVLSLCAACGPSLSNEIPRAWAYFQKSAQSAVSPQELDWRAYNKNSGDRFYNSVLTPGVGGSRIQYAPNVVAPTMHWAVPIQSPEVAGCPTYGFPQFPAYGSGEPAAAPKK